MSVLDQEPIDAVWEVTSPEHNRFSYRPAGPVPRFLAMLLDGLICVAAISAIWVLGIVFFPLLGASAAALAAIGTFAVYWFYAAGMESWNRGRTLGKMALGLRVIDQQGGPASGPSCLLRHLLSTADLLGGGLLGLCAMATSGGFRRLGDLVAGTVVVHQRHRRMRQVRPVSDEGVLNLARELPPGLALRVDVTLQRALTSFVASRQMFRGPRRRELAGEVAPLLARMCGRDEDDDPDLLCCAVHLRACHPDVDIEALDQMRLKKAEKTRTRLSQPCLRQHWRRMEQLLASPAKRWQARHVRDLSTLTRSVGADLALADAYHLPETSTGYLEDLVARGHLRLYRPASRCLQRLAHMLMYQAPLLLVRDVYLLIASLVFFGPFLVCAVWIYYDPQAAVDMLGRDAITSFEEMYADPPRSAGFEGGGERTGFYIHNNVGIALRCFAWGILLGIGSLFMLLFNGVFLGMIFGYMLQADAPVSDHFAEFVMAHGPFELIGIAMAGGAGLRMGWSLVASQGLTRLHALQQGARQALPAISTAAVFITIAAFIEAFVSPSALPWAVKAGVCVLTLLLIFAYVCGWGLTLLLRHGREGGQHG